MTEETVAMFLIECFLGQISLGNLVLEKTLLFLLN